jgi:hypothetical protein
MKTYNLIHLLALLVLAACGPVPTPIVTLTALQPSTATPNLTWTALPPLTPTTDLSYDPDPSTVILNADVLPRGATCRRAMVAGLRLWGDGLLYLNDPWYRPTDSTLWGASLSPSQVEDVLTFLSKQEFLHDWTPSPADVPSAAGTGITLAVHLRHYSIVHGSGNLAWPFYRTVLEHLSPMLRPMIPNVDTDSRILNLDNDAPDCIPPTRVRPDYTATLAVLETQQPSPRPEHFEGIWEWVPGDIAPSDVVVQNTWQRQIANVPVLVEAGTLEYHPETGVLAVTTWPVSYWAFYYTPANTGSVRIVAEQNNRLTLQSVQGATYYFDVPSLKFAESLNQVLPTPTPTPVVTGYPVTTAAQSSPYPAP